MILRFVSIVFFTGLAWPAVASDLEPGLRKLAETQVSAWISDPVLRDAVEAQNDRTRGLTQAEIDDLDRTWRDQIDAEGGLIAEVLGNPLSRYLSDVKATGKGQYTEIFVTDAIGLNVGQSDLTSDYWQGDEAKWKVPNDSHDIHIGEVEFDESSQTYQVQLSVPIMKGEQMIGTLTVGVDAERLSQ